jgi:hypothetical protein
MIYKRPIRHCRESGKGTSLCGIKQTNITKTLFLTPKYFVRRITRFISDEDKRVFCSECMEHPSIALMLLAYYDEVE